MEKVVKTTDGSTLCIVQTTRLGHDVMDKTWQQKVV